MSMRWGLRSDHDDEKVMGHAGAALPMDDERGAPRSSRQASLDPISWLARQKRPGLLMAAACHLAANGQRSLLARRALGNACHREGRRRLLALIGKELDLETLRKSDAPHYKVQRHVEILGAIIAELDVLGSSGSEEPPHPRPCLRAVQGNMAR